MFSDTLLAWYDQHQRHFPWRAKPGITPNPYHVWLSEVMLQQTQTGTVISYFNTFIQKWPTVESLANADLDEVLHAWAGLGYYSRARSLHKAAKLIAKSLPSNEKEWLTIPGVGPYTAGAISAIAYDQQTSPVDGNIARVFARLYQIQEVKHRLYDQTKQHLQKVVPTARNGDFIQALMDVGATVCMPTNALCDLCPLQNNCLSFQMKTTNDYPLKQIKPIKPNKYGIVYWIENNRGQILLQKRPEKGLLGGMMGFPTSPWTEHKSICKASGQLLGLAVKHTFTHFHLTLEIKRQQVTDNQGVWAFPSEFKDYALPTLMKKVAAAVLKQKPTQA